MLRRCPDLSNRPTNLPFHHSSLRVRSSCFTRYLPIFFHSLLTLSLSLSLVPSAGSIAGDRFVKLLIFFLALRPRSCHPDRAPLYPRILAFIPDVVEKYQPRCVTRLLLSLLLLFPPLFLRNHPRHHRPSSSCLCVSSFVGLDARHTRNARVAPYDARVAASGFRYPIHFDPAPRPPVRITLKYPRKQREFKTPSLEESA